MKKFTRKRSLDLEVSGTIAGFAIVILTVVAFWDYKNGQQIFLGAFALGTVLNGLLAGMNWYQRRMVLGTLFTLLAVVYLGIFVFAALTV